MKIAQYFFTFLLLFLLLPCCKHSNSLQENIKDVNDQGQEEVIAVLAQNLRNEIPQGRVGNLLSDLVFEYAEDEIPEDIDFVMLQHVMLPNEINAGEVYLSEIKNWVPEDEKLVLFEISGIKLFGILSHMIEANEAGNSDPFLAMSGLHIHVKRGVIYDSKCQGLMLNKDQVYQGVAHAKLFNSEEPFTLTSYCSIIRNLEIPLWKVFAYSLDKRDGSIGVELDQRIIFEF